jgi:hypothetical protein
MKSATQSKTKIIDRAVNGKIISNDPRLSCTVFYTENCFGNDVQVGVIDDRELRTTQ